MAAFVSTAMSTYDPSHNPAHVHRVVTLARKILAAEQRRSNNSSRQAYIPYDPHIVGLAALLHDIGDRKYSSAFSCCRYRGRDRNKNRDTSRPQLHGPIRPPPPRRRPPPRRPRPNNRLPRLPHSRTRRPPQNPQLNPPRRIPRVCHHTGRGPTRCAGCGGYRAVFYVSWGAGWDVGSGGWGVGVGECDWAFWGEVGEVGEVGGVDEDREGDGDG